MMTVKSTKTIIEIAEVLNSATTFTEAELAGRITMYNGAVWDSIWIPQEIIDKARDKRGNLSIYDLGLELVKAGYACIDKIRFDRVDAHGYVYTLYQLPTQGMAVQNVGGIRFMSNVEEFSEFFNDDDESTDDSSSITKEQQIIFSKMQKIQDALPAEAGSEAVEIKTPKGIFTGLAINNGKSSLEISIPGARVYNLLIRKDLGGQWIRILRDIPRGTLSKDYALYPFITWDNLPFDKDGRLDIDAESLLWGGYDLLD